MCWAPDQRDPLTGQAPRHVVRVVAEPVALECDLSFICLAERAGEPVIAAALGALDAVRGVTAFILKLSKLSKNSIVR